MHAFERHKFEAKFLIQHYLTDVLEELASKLLTKYDESLKNAERTEKPSLTEDISILVKKEVKRQIQQELKKKKKKK